LILYLITERKKTKKKNELSHNSSKLDTSPEGDAKGL
jgi:hypothetical protein